MSVMRLKPLPIAENRGRLIVTSPVAEATLQALRRFRGPDGRHEGLVYWAGRRADKDTLVLSALVPVCDHRQQYVMADEREIGRLSRKARSCGLTIAAQVHSHPGNGTQHSDGDDDLVLMPHEGMFSLVIARYGDGGVRLTEGAGLHQYQDGRWVQIKNADALIVVPPSLL